MIIQKSGLILEQRVNVWQSRLEEKKNVQFNYNFYDII